MDGPARATARLVGGRDLETIAGQLGRRPHAMSRVVARCPYGLPAAVEDLPCDGRGRPFPTLFYATCPTLVAGVSRLESGGGVRAWTSRLADDAELAGSMATAVAATRRRRRDLVRRYRLTMADGGASLASGVGGVGDVRAVKCLHGHVAHALAHPSYAFGRAVLAEVADPWCDDHRCTSFVVGEGARP